MSLNIRLILRTRKYFVPEFLGTEKFRHGYDRTEDRAELNANAGDHSYRASALLRAKNLLIKTTFNDFFLEK